MMMMMMMASSYCSAAEEIEGGCRMARRHSATNPTVHSLEVRVVGFRQHSSSAVVLSTCYSSMCYYIFGQIDDVI